MSSSQHSESGRHVQRAVSRGRHIDSFVVNGRKKNSHLAGDPLGPGCNSGTTRTETRSWLDVRHRGSAVTSPHAVTGFTLKQ